ncbi:CDP-alcohol phosphatidyltransferase family protein, partial [Burkholderia contaminans]
MDQRKTATRSEPPLPRTWDARLARSLVRPLVD